MALTLNRAPIDEVVVGFVLDQPIGPDAVAAGRYLSERGDRFSRHEIHDPIIPDSTIILGRVSPRVWLVSSDDAWLVQLQQDRFVANWRRRGNASYPGFTRAGGAMHFVLEEFEHFRQFCAKEHQGSIPNAISFEVAKLDLLVQGKHWTNPEDAATLLPALSGALACMSKPTADVGFRWQEDVSEGTLTVSVVPARLRTDPSNAAFQLEFRLAGVVSSNIEEHLLRANTILNEAFERVVPESERHRRFT